MPPAPLSDGTVTLRARREEDAGCSKVLARRTFRVRAWDLGAALDWATARAAGHGFTG